MCKFFYVMPILFFLSCRGQKSGTEAKQSDTTYILSEEKIMQSSNKTFLEQYLSKYVDSLNNAATEADLPFFLSDSQFDYRNKGAWESFHNPISVREQIINRVINCKPLQLIIQSNNENFRKKPLIEDDLRLPFIKLSFYDLVMKRSKILQCK